MISAETYVFVTSEAVQQALQENNFIAYQGQRLLFVKDTYTPKLMHDFLEHVFPYVSKITVQGDEGKYYIICDKYNAIVKEPFGTCENVSGKYGNNIASLAAIICTRTL